MRRGFLDEKRAHVAMAAVINEHEIDLLKEAETRAGSFDQAVAGWLEYLKHEKRVKPSTLADYKVMLSEPKSRSKKEQRGARIMRAFGGRELSDISTTDVRVTIECLQFDSSRAQ